MSRSEQIMQQLDQPEAHSQARVPLPTTIDGMLKDKRYQAQIAAALPKHVTPERITRIALTEVRKNPALGKCQALSLFGAIIQSAQLGLELGGGLGHAYLVPFKRGNAAHYDVNLIIGYRGMIDLARRSGQIISLQAHVVFENDKFNFEYGLDEKLKHIPNQNIQQRGNLTAVYAIAKLKGGGHQIEVLFKQEIDVIRQHSKAKNGPWETHYEEMAKKTAVRRLFKYLPVSVELQRATLIDELNDAGMSQDNSNIFDGEVVIDAIPEPVQEDDHANH